MKQRYLLKLDPKASAQANLDFLEKCLQDIKNKRKQLKKKIIITHNQIDLEDAIRDSKS